MNATLQKVRGLLVQRFKEIEREKGDHPERGSDLRLEDAALSEVLDAVDDVLNREEQKDEPF